MAAAMDAHSQARENCRPCLPEQVVTAWNGLAISAFALASRSLASPPRDAATAAPATSSSSSSSCPSSALFPADGVPPATYLRAAQSAAAFLRRELFDEASGTLRRSYCRGPSGVMGGWVRGWAAHEMGWSDRWVSLCAWVLGGP